MPAVSAIVSLYNHARYLSQCVTSVLEQSFADLELIIVDDASTDDSLEQAHALSKLDPKRVKVYSNPKNAGVSSTRNFGVFRSKSPILAFLDADDYWRADKLAQQMQVFADHPDVGLCHSGVRIDCDTSSAKWAAAHRGLDSEAFARWSGSFDAFCREAVGFNQLDYFQRLLVGNNICLSSVALRKEVFKLGRGFVDGKRCQCEDWLLWLKLSMFTRFQAIPEQLTAYRFHPVSHTAQVFMRADFDFLDVRQEMIQAARRFDPPRFDALFQAIKA